MDNISRTTFSKVFYFKKVWILINILLKFVLKGPINIIPALIGFDNSLAPFRRQAIIWTNDD